LRSCRPVRGTELNDASGDALHEARGAEKRGQRSTVARGTNEAASAREVEIRTGCVLIPELEEGPRSKLAN
jgi:hypothetical protein